MEILILIVVSFLTSTISAVLGMGGGIILLGIMALLIPEGYMAIALHGIIQLFSNTIRLYVFRKNINKQIIQLFSIGAVIGVMISILIIFLLIQLFHVETANKIKVEYLKPLIGLFILWYLFFNKSIKLNNGVSFSFVGIISGISSIFIGATGPLIAPFFLNNNLSKKEIIANKAFCQTIIHLTKIPLFIYFFKVNYLNEFNIFIPVIFSVFAGTLLGKKVLNFIPEVLFNKLFKFTLSVIALKLIIESLV